MLKDGGTDKLLEDFMVECTQVQIEEEELYDVPIFR